MLELEYLMDKEGQFKAVVIPIELWTQLFLTDDISAEELSEAIEAPLLSRKEALSWNM
jgi:hypothetical protein